MAIGATPPPPMVMVVERRRLVRRAGAQISETTFATLAARHVFTFTLPLAGARRPIRNSRKTSSRVIIVALARHGILSHHITCYNISSQQLV